MGSPKQSRFNVEKKGVKPKHRRHSVKEVLIDFTEHTTSHGLPHINRAKTKHAAIFWIIICIVCMVAFVWQAIVIVHRYFQHEKITQIVLQIENNPFPAITLCNLNPYKKSLASKYYGFSEIINAFEKKRSTVEPEDDSDNVISREERSAENNAERYIPVYAHCYCPTQFSGECVPFSHSVPTVNDTQCLCYYDPIRQTPWPCYSTNSWSFKLCDSQCATSTGGCRAVNFSDLSTTDFNRSHKGHYNLVRCLCHKTYCSLTGSRNISKLWELIPPLEQLTRSTISTKTPTTTSKPTTTSTHFPGFENNANDMNTVQLQAQSSMVFVAANLTEEQIANISYTLDEFILRCSFNQKDCNVPRDFTRKIDATYGNCYTFNADPQQSSSTQRAGPMYGLSTLIFVNGSDYLPMTNGKGVRINISPANEHPFLDTDGYSAPTGFLTSVGIRLKKIERLPWPHYDCLDEHADANAEEDYIFKPYRYSLEGCYRTCLQKALVKNCKCSDPAFPKYRNYSHCQLANSSTRECLNGTKTLMGGLHGNFTGDCKCKKPCKEILYDVTVSVVKWPHSASVLNYYDICSNITDNCETYLQNEAAYIEIYYEYLGSEVFRESEAYPLANLLADFGGQLGLWMGMFDLRKYAEVFKPFRPHLLAISISVITCTEILVFFWDLSKVCYRTFQKKRVCRQSKANNNYNSKIDSIDFTVNVKRNLLPYQDFAYIDSSEEVEN